MDHATLVRNLERLAGTDLEVPSEYDMQRAIVAAHRAIEDDLAHYVAPRIRSVQSQGADRPPMVQAVLGAGIAADVARVTPDVRDVLVLLEPEPGAAFVLLATAPLESWAGECRVHVYRDPERFEAAVTEVQRRWKRVAGFVARPSRGRLSSLIEPFERFIGRADRLGATEATTRGALHFERLENGLRNLRRRPALRGATGTSWNLSGVPIVLIGAGPSLDRALPVLARESHRRRAVFVAASTAVRPLRAAGIEPDVVLVVEGRAQTHLGGVEPLRSTLLVASACTAPAHFEWPVREALTYLSSSFPLTRALPEMAVVPSLGNVIAEGLVVTAMWGCGPIALVGADLALRGDSMYAAGVCGGSAPGRHERVAVKGRDGEDLVSPWTFDADAQAIEEFVALLREREEDFRVVNASIGGRRLAGTEDQPLERFLDGLEVTPGEPRMLLDLASEGAVAIADAEVGRTLDDRAARYARIAAALREGRSVLASEVVSALPEFDASIRSLDDGLRRWLSGRAEADDLAGLAERFAGLARAASGGPRAETGSGPVGVEILGRADAGPGADKGGCAVVMPVGPGHAALAAAARESVREAFRADPGRFERLTIVTVDDGGGSLGRSKARNIGVRRAAALEAAWVFFLDADDLATPDVFARVAPYLDDRDAVWGAIWSFEGAAERPTPRRGQIASLTKLEDLLLEDPYATLQMGHFVRTLVAIRNPFDERLDAGEDFDYYLRVWEDSRCVKIADPLFFNRRGSASTGPRSASGEDRNRAVETAIVDAAARYELQTSFEHDGEAFQFRIAFPADPVQRHHRHGLFHELDALEIVRSLAARGGTVIDVGAHVGNHAVFFDRFLRPERTVLFEPNVEVHRVLRRNLELNGVRSADLRKLPLALGAAPGRGTLRDVRRYDPSRAWVEPRLNGAVDVTSIDRLRTEAVRVIKIDAGRRSLDVFDGALETIERDDPVLSIDVPRDALDRGRVRLASLGYGEVHEVEGSIATRLVVGPRRSRE